MKYKLFALVCILATTAAARAGTVVCSGKVKMLAYHASDAFMLQLDSMNSAVYFCSPERIWTVTGTVHTTGPETCKMMFSTFLSAQLAGKKIDSLYLDGDGTPDNCKSFGSWSNFNIRFFAII